MASIFSICWIFILTSFSIHHPHYCGYCVYCTASAISVNHVITLLEQERLGLITQLWGSLRWRGAKLSFKPVYVTEENVRNDKRPATGTGRQKLFTEIKRQVGGILTILHIALHQAAGAGCMKLQTQSLSDAKTLLWCCLCLSPSHYSNSVDPVLGPLFCIPLSGMSFCILRQVFLSLAKI